MHPAAASYCSSWDRCRMPEEIPLIRDKAYEGNETRQLVLDLGMIPVVPPKSNRLDPWEYDRELYKKRNEIERRDFDCRPRAHPSATVSSSRGVTLHRDRGRYHALSRPSPELEDDTSGTAVGVRVDLESCYGLSPSTGAHGQLSFLSASSGPGHKLSRGEAKGPARIFASLIPSLPKKR